MARSIRATLLFWYALIFATALGAFGWTVYSRLESTALAHVDDELRSRAAAVAASIQGSGRFEITLSDELHRYFQQSGSTYRIVDAKGRVVDYSDPRPEPAEWRTVTSAGPDGSRVVVGRSIAALRAELDAFLTAIVVAGAAVLAFALAGGWFLASRALRPIAKISEKAAEISAKDLSKRIDLVEVESELGTLTCTLNTTFQRLEEAFDRQARFTADASHELRTPLSILLAECESALKRERTAPEYRESLETCVRAARRMKAVVDSLLTLARADAGVLKLEKERFDLKPMVEETAAMLRPLAEERGVTLSVAAEPMEFEGDRGLLREVFTNLISNAIRYNRPGGRVEIALRNGRTLTVADTGMGIAEKDRPHIFERFYRVDKARSREQGSSGLGLAITRWIVEAHGGTIAFASREGEGTTFTVQL